MASLILFYHRILRSQSHCLKSINVSNVNLCYITELHELLIFVVLQANGDSPLPSLPSSSSSQHKLALSQHRGKHSGMLAFRFFLFTKSQEDKIKRKEVPKAGGCASWTEQVIIALYVLAVRLVVPGDEISDPIFYFIWFRPLKPKWSISIVSKVSAFFTMIAGGSVLSQVIL